MFAFGSGFTNNLKKNQLYIVQYIVIHLQKKDFKRSYLIGKKFHFFLRVTVYDNYSNQVFIYK